MPLASLVYELIGYGSNEAAINVRLGSHTLMEPTAVTTKVIFIFQWAFAALTSAS